MGRPLMARLINPGIGEVVDRLTILSLKILIGTEKGRDIQHFIRERDVLLTQVRARTLNGAWFESTLELSAVNGQLWQAEDQMRAYREQYDRLPRAGVVGSVGPDHPVWVGVGQVAFRIQQLNDRRAELIGVINTTAGDAGGLEKV